MTSCVQYAFTVASFGGLLLFLPRDAMRKRGTSCWPVSVCLSVCHTVVYCIKTATDTKNFFLFVK